jgi:hypothetical protein
MGLVDHDSITFGVLLNRQLAIARKDGWFREAVPECDVASDLPARLDLAHGYSP